jgi:hypothetical protein
MSKYSGCLRVGSFDDTELLKVFVDLLNVPDAEIWHPFSVLKALDLSLVEFAARARREEADHVALSTQDGPLHICGNRVELALHIVLLQEPIKVNIPVSLDLA